MNYCWNGAVHMLHPKTRALELKKGLCTVPSYHHQVIKTSLQRYPQNVKVVQAAVDLLSFMTEDVDSCATFVAVEGTLSVSCGC